MSVVRSRQNKDGDLLGALFFMIFKFGNLNVYIIGILFLYFYIFCK